MRREDIESAHKMLVDQDILRDMLTVMKNDDMEFRSYSADMTVPLSYISPNRRIMIRNKIIEVLMDEIEHIDKLIEKI